MIPPNAASLYPTITFSVSGDNIPLATLKQIGRQVENDLRGIDGISQIQNGTESWTVTVETRICADPKKFNRILLHELEFVVGNGRL